MHVITSGAAASNDRILVAREAAERLNVGTKWVYDHAESGVMPCFRVGRMLRFSESQLNDWLASCAQGSFENVILDESPLMTVTDLERYMHVSRAWVYEARRSKGLPHFKLDGKLRFARPMIDAWLTMHSLNERGL